jgi:crotonobetainyl-CoA:carnitine CoA-transferase CaiB-like acyl-CoA transferase
MNAPTPAAVATLHGVRVLDLTQMMAGPLGTMLLGDLGADVVKIEAPDGEISRQMGDTFVGGESDFFLSLNRNKRSVVLDLKSAEGVDALRALVARADVLIENFRPGTAERLGVGYDTLRQVNPRLVYCAVTGFRPDGPDRDRAATDPIVQAMSGLMSLTGTPESGPLKTGFPQGDFAAPLFATIGILSALLRARADGVGQRIDVSMFDCALFSMIPREGYYFAREEAPPLRGNAHAQIVPGNTYRTADDRYLMLFAHTEKFWRLLLEALGDDELGCADFATNAQRVQRRAEVDARIGAIIARRTIADWDARLTTIGAMFAPVRTMGDVLEDPMVRATMVDEIEHPRAGRIRTFGNPIRLSGAPAVAHRPPPLLGQHTEEVLRDWGVPPLSP